MLILISAFCRIGVPGGVLAGLLSHRSMIGSSGLVLM